MEYLIITLAFVSVCFIIGSFSYAMGYKKGHSNGWQDKAKLNEEFPYKYTMEEAQTWN